MDQSTEFRGYPADFETKKRKYFSSLALKLKEAFRLHKAFDLLTKNEQGVKDWRNASQHQLVVGVRTRALAKMLGLPPEISDDLLLAGAVHDFYKRKTVEVTPKGVSMDLQQQIDAEENSKLELVKANFPQNVIKYAGASGTSPETIARILQILKQEQNTAQEELGELILHYVDDFTKDTEWVKPAEATAEGKKNNALNRRIKLARNNPKYKLVDDDGVKYFGGKKTLDMQEEVGEEVEKILAGRLSEITGSTIDPKDLPALIDQEIRKEIENFGTLK